MYNPVNMTITDPERLQERDLREKNKKKRYEIRFVAEDVARQEGFVQAIRQEQLSLNKISHQRVMEEKERGFDIITNGAV